MANTSLLLGVLSGSYPRRRLLRCSYSAQRAHMTHLRVLFLVGRPRNASLNAPRGAVLEGKTEPRDLSGPSGWATPPTVHDRAMAGKFLPLDDHDDDEEDSLLDASVRVERFERKVMGRAWAACAILSLTFAGVALYRHMSAAAPAAGSDVVYPTYMPPVGRMLREWRGRTPAISKSSIRARARQAIWF